MPDQRVQDEQGNIHVFPDEATPEMIAKAMGVVPPSMATNLKTGQGMQEYAAQKAKQFFTGTGDQGFYDKTGRKFMGPSGEPLTYMEKAGQNLEDRQTKLAVAQNRAINSPTPFTNSAFPLLGATGVGASVVKQGLKATAKPIIKGVVGAAGGSAAGSYGGRQIGNIFGEPEAGAKIGGIGGGIAGMLMGGMSEPMEPEVFPVSKSPGPYRGPRSVPKPQPPWETPGNPGAPLPAAEDFYANRAADLTRRGTAQAALDRMAPKPPQSSPFPGATSSLFPAGNAELPPVPEGPAPQFLPSIKKTPPPFLPNATSSVSSLGNAELPAIPQGEPTPFPTVPRKAPTGGANQPFEPLVYESDAQYNQLQQRAANLKRQASAAGTYHAAQGATGKQTNLQQRIGKKYLPWERPEE